MGSLKDAAEGGDGLAKEGHVRWEPVGFYNNVTDGQRRKAGAGCGQVS